MTSREVQGFQLSHQKVGNTATREAWRARLGCTGGSVGSLELTSDGSGVGRLLMQR